MAAMTEPETLAVAREIMDAAGFCFLVTRGSGGEANARLMQPFPPAEDLTVWMGASPGSRKVREIERYWRVTLAYGRPQAGACVTLLGTATLVTALEMRQRYWREEFLPFWPAGPTDHNYALMRVEPSRLEVMHLERGVAPVPYGLQPAVLERQDGDWVLQTGAEAAL
jgi:general stress protein 26